MNLYEKSAFELSELIKTKKISVEELTKETINKIKLTDKQLNSFISIDEENSLKKAREVDKKISKNDQLSPLAGIPIGVKDNIMVKGLKNTCASKMLKDYTAQYNSTVTEKLNNDDLVIVGKLNMDEFAMGSSSETSYFGPIKNPHNFEKVPGGSSGGSASCLASGQTSLSLGSD
ncbi:MAG: amidase family protein, partial [Oscillospiraceae bacterium]